MLETVTLGALKRFVFYRACARRYEFRIGQA